MLVFGSPYFDLARSDVDSMHQYYWNESLWGAHLVPTKSMRGAMGGTYNGFFMAHCGFFPPKLKNLSRLTESFNEQIQYVVHKFFSFPSFLLFLQNKLYLKRVKMDRVKLTCPGCTVAIFWPVSNTGWNLEHGPPHTNSNRPLCHPYL